MSLLIPLSAIEISMLYLNICKIRLVLEEYCRVLALKQWACEDHYMTWFYKVSCLIMTPYLLKDHLGQLTRRYLRLRMTTPRV